MLSVEDKQDIKDIVNITLKELKKSHLLKDTSDAIYNDVSEQLFKYYKTGEHDPKIKAALEEFKDDIYLNVIPLYYKSAYTIESIAEMMNVDVSTIVRNKKRICLSLYLMLE